MYHQFDLLFQLQKELLDAELELFNAQQEGSEQTAEIQKKVNALSIEAAKQGLLPTSRSPGTRGGSVGHHRGGGGRGGHFYNPRGRGSFYSPRGYRGGRGKTIVHVHESVLRDIFGWVHVDSRAAMVS